MDKNSFIEKELIMYREIEELKSSNLLLREKLRSMEKQMLEIQNTNKQNEISSRKPNIYKPEAQNPCIKCEQESFIKCEKQCGKYYCFQCIKPTYGEREYHFWCDECKKT